MDPQQQALYGLVDNQALIVREGHICDIVPETQLPVSGDNIHDMQGRLVTRDLSIATRIWCLPVTAPQSGNSGLTARHTSILALRAAALTRRYQQPAPVREETLYLLARERMMRLASEGVTLLEIKSGYGLELATEENCCASLQNLPPKTLSTLAPRYWPLMLRQRSIVTTRTATSLWSARR